MYCGSKAEKNEVKVSSFLGRKKKRKLKKTKQNTGESVFKEAESRRKTYLNTISMQKRN